MEIQEISDELRPSKKQYKIVVCVELRSGYIKLGNERKSEESEMLNQLWGVESTVAMVGKCYNA